MSKSKQPMSTSTFMDTFVKGNPLVTAIEKRALSEDDLSHKITVRCDNNLGFAEWDCAGMEVGLDTGFFMSPPHAYELYSRIRLLMMMGYVKRHPASYDYDKHIHLADLKKIPAPKKLKGTGNSIFIRGRSGGGKTTLMESVLDTIPTVIEHPPSPLTGGREIRQVSWVKVDMSKGASRKAFYRNVIQEIDKVLGTSFAAKIPSRYVEDERFLYMIKVCRMACLGVLVIDDVQWALSGTAANANQKVTNEFLEQLFNLLGIPLVFIGTPEAEKLKGFAEQTGRRLAHNGMIEINSDSVTSTFWRDMVKTMFVSFLGMDSDHINNDFYHIIHYYTEGNASRLKTIVGNLLRREVTGNITAEHIHEAYSQEKGAFEELKTPFIQLSQSKGKKLSGKATSSKPQKNTANKTTVEDSCEDEDDFEDAFIITGGTHGQ
ncbi:ATP-binding protein [Alteromonas lipotrueae]|uniref:ATP-binding protein n=1 Tax=Alteromonas lipotrueae TaxID=2803814 RepID=UPI001C48B4B6|nr:ATP-binding protein [Alteromonas lipotrueae]